MRIERVHRKPGVVSIDFSEEGAGDKRDVFTMTLHDNPSPAFDEAMKAIKAHVVAMLELDPAYGETLAVTHVRFSYKGKTNIMHADFTAQKDLANARRPFVINTPIRASEKAAVSIGKKKGRGRPSVKPDMLTQECVAALATLTLEAENYVNGKRGQLQFTFDNAAGVQKSKSDSDTELLDMARAIIMETKRASVPMLQKKLKVKQPVAFKLMNKLEEMGIVGPPTPSGGPREILVTEAA